MNTGCVIFLIIILFGNHEEFPPACVGVGDRDTPKYLGIDIEINTYTTHNFFINVNCSGFVLSVI